MKIFSPATLFLTAAMLGLSFASVCPASAQSKSDKPLLAENLTRYQQWQQRILGSALIVGRGGKPYQIKLIKEGDSARYIVVSKDGTAASNTLKLEDLLDDDLLDDEGSVLPLAALELLRNQPLFNNTPANEQVRIKLARRYAKLAAKANEFRGELSTGTFFSGRDTENPDEDKSRGYYPTLTAGYCYWRAMELESDPKPRGAALRGEYAKNAYNRLRNGYRIAEAAKSKKGAKTPAASQTSSLASLKAYERATDVYESPVIFQILLSTAMQARQSGVELTDEKQSRDIAGLLQTLNTLEARYPKTGAERYAELTEPLYKMGGLRAINPGLEQGFHLQLKANSDAIRAATMGFEQDLDQRNSLKIKALKQQRRAAVANLQTDLDNGINSLLSNYRPVTIVGGKEADRGVELEAGKPFTVKVDSIVPIDVYFLLRKDNKPIDLKKDAIDFKTGCYKQSVTFVMPPIKPGETFELRWKVAESVALTETRFSSQLADSLRVSAKAGEVVVVDPTKPPVPPPPAKVLALDLASRAEQYTLGRLDTEQAIICKPSPDVETVKWEVFAGSQYFTGTISAKEIKAREGKFFVTMKDLPPGHYQMQVTASAANAETKTENIAVNVYGRGVALVIGCNYYTSGAHLKHAAEDARQFQSRLRNQFAYDADTVLYVIGTGDKNTSAKLETNIYSTTNPLLNGEIKPNNASVNSGIITPKILDDAKTALQKVITKLNPSHIILFYAGHGRIKESTDVFELGNGEDVPIVQYGQDILSGRVEAMKDANSAPPEIVGFYDCCRNTESAQKNSSNTRFVIKGSLDGSYSYVPLFSCKPAQKSNENQQGELGIEDELNNKFNQGFFTQALLRALESGKKFTLDELILATDENLEKLMTKAERKMAATEAIWKKQGLPPPYSTPQKLGKPSEASDIKAVDNSIKGGKK